MEEIGDANKSAYDATASEYSKRKDLMAQNNRKVIETYATFLDKRFPGRERKDMSILDIGVGSGLDLSIFHELGYQTFGNDMSEKMIEEARKNSPESVFYCSDFTEYRFGRKFSGLYAQAFIHLFPKNLVHSLFEKMFTMLEPEGLIHFSTTIHDKPSEEFREKIDYETKVRRFRKWWTLEELNGFLKEIPNIEVLHQYIVSDPLEKQWVNTIVGEKSLL
jgi:SAM-dependent methyltransferase